ncbi:proton-conducting transporter membrane subunit, partial [Salmonella sp. s51228]|uniref:proton-conducting transporter transmembrane domain-containing protein n=1 Tax=Salmonella sp. s51228 TaxID=3159652 RepID=UPI00397F3B3B
KRLALPFTKRCIIIGRISLSGFPFLAGYYSKDLILEIAQLKKIKLLIIILSLIATLMTATYRLRVVYFLSSRHLKTNPICPVKENHPRLYFPLLRLIMGTLVMG